MNTCAVLLSAWNVEPSWLLEAIASVNEQLPREGWRYELRLGVDGCEATARALREEGVPFWWSSENVGAYVMRNSLAELAPADAFSIFDADDQMLPGYLFHCLRVVEKGDIAGADRVEKSKNGTKVKRFKSGVCVIPEKAWRRLGGFRGDRVSSDTDLLLRARHLRFKVVRVRKALYVRRVHPDSLTNAPATGGRSGIRRQIKLRHHRLRARRRLVAPMATTPLELVTPNERNPS
jgi:glycosyltransferase involved in cell wall biosynthesis